MKTYRTAVDNVYAEKENEVILGLTGRTGAGCSTVAGILQTMRYSDLDLSFPAEESLMDSKADKRKFAIVDRYMSEPDRWMPFTCIEGSSVILSYILETKGLNKEDESSALSSYLSKLQKKKEGVNLIIPDYKKLKKDIYGHKHLFKEYQKNPIKSLKELLENQKMGDETYKKKIDSYYDLYIVKLPEYKRRLRKIFINYDCFEEKKQKIQDERPVKYHFYTYLFQKIGNNIRSSGKAYEDAFNEGGFFDFTKRIELLIDLIKIHNRLNGGERTRVCVDALRNPFEAIYLKDRYRSFYLMSISTDENVRKGRLAKIMDIESQAGLDMIEYPDKLELSEIFYHQNIGACFEMSDIHILNNIENDKHNKFLKWQLVKFLSLMFHPGLITPSHIERCMQLAFNAKYNSGCLSRQVGAVVTGSDFSVKSVGWNDVAKEQVSCGLRDIEECYKGDEPEYYSEYEKENEEFSESLKNINSRLKKIDLGGRYFPYCFKDIYNGYTGEKNQVYTRSLHAEENAFLQISKYGGQGIRGGYLFCTASPCELCSKKAYQLGIKKIFYIDPYPGISKAHILNFGKGTSNPEMNLFYGAIGEAYMSLYRPIMSYKDELELYSGINVKKIAKGEKDEKIPKSMDLKYKMVECSLEFISREQLESIREVDFEIVNGEYKKLDRQVTWTGSSYDYSELIDGSGYKLKETKDQVSPYRYEIEFDSIKKKGDKVRYKMKTVVKDETKVMHPYFSHIIKYPTQQLKLSVIIPKEEKIIKRMKYIRYADMEMETQYLGPEDYEKRVDGDKLIYELDISAPNLFYTYSLEWEFEK